MTSLTGCLANENSSRWVNPSCVSGHTPALLQYSVPQVVLGFSSVLYYCDHTGLITGWSPSSHVAALSRKPAAVVCMLALSGATAAERGEGEGRAAPPPSLAPHLQRVATACVHVLSAHLLLPTCRSACCNCSQLRRSWSTPLTPLSPARAPHTCWQWRLVPLWRMSPRCLVRGC